MHERITHVEYNPNLEEMSRPKRVCAYARVSGERDEAFHSLAAQVSYYQNLIAEHSDWSFVEVFSDRGITGTKDERPGFQAMLTACREGRVDIVLAKSITRFARNTIILLETVRELKSFGVDVHFEEEHIHTLSAGGELMISLLAARAQEESRSASENQKWRIRRKYEKGEPINGNALGYRLVDGQFLIDEDEEQIVLRIFSMFLSGMGASAIAKKLRKEGVKTRLGNANWSVYGIQKILRNEKYCGDLVLQKSYTVDYLTKKMLPNRGEKPIYTVHDDHDPIIDRKTFNRVQEEISRRAKKSSAKSGDCYAFTSILICGNCGKHFIRKYSNAGTAYKKAAWCCNTSNTWGKEACPSTQHILENILIEKTREVLGLDTSAELSGDMLREHITGITVPERNVLIYHFRDGTEKRVGWQYRSRRESWTPEMREKAREKTKARYEANRKEAANGTESTN